MKRPYNSPQPPQAAAKRLSQRPSAPPITAPAATAEPPVGHGRAFLMVGLSLLICALAGLYGFARARAGGEHASLISQSIGVPKH